MAATIVLQSGSDTESLSQDGISPVGSPSRKVNFSDHEKEVEDDGSFDHNNSTLQWENAMNNSLSDDVKLTAVMHDDDSQPLYLDRRSSSDEGLGTFSSNYKEELSNGKRVEDVEDQKDEDDNQMPDIASQVFVNSVNVNVLNGSPVLSRECSVDLSPSCIRKKEQREMPMAYELKSFDPEKQALLCQSSTTDQQYGMHPCRAGSDCSMVDTPPSKRGCCRYQCCTSSSLKSVASFFGALVIFPVFLYGAYVFLPFDVPLMSTMGHRVVYTLRCGVFAMFPVVLGLVVYGISRVCTASFDPFGKREKEVEIHRRYVTQSSYLFVLYFFNMAVLATYLPQELLKLIPLLTGLFALSRLIYWLAFAMGRSFRGFGYGLSFLPLVTMLLANIYFMFALDPQNMLAIEDKATDAATPAPSGKLRMWG